MTEAWNHGSDCAELSQCSLIPASQVVLNYPDPWYGFHGRFKEISSTVESPQWGDDENLRGDEPSILWQIIGIDNQTWGILEDLATEWWIWVCPMMGMAPNWPSFERGRSGLKPWYFGVLVQVGKKHIGDTGFGFVMNQQAKQSRV